jgi:hypothetical protein
VSYNPYGPEPDPVMDDLEAEAERLQREMDDEDETIGGLLAADYVLNGELDLTWEIDI